MSARPENTYAIVVGIESYSMQDCTPLDGPAPDACKFVDWLRAQSVPADNIKLFLSPMKANEAVRPADAAFATVEPANGEVILNAFLEWAQPKTGDLFILFWGGHGVSDTEDHRFLFFSDATVNRRRSLNLTAMMKKMSTPEFGLREQMLFVDACGTFGDQVGVPKVQETYGESAAQDPTQQNVLFAAGPGEVAKNITVEKTGMFARSLFKALNTETAFPPDPRRLADLVAEDFEQLRKEGATRQIPGRYHVVIRGRKERATIEGTRPTGHATGTLVPKLYDRTAQDGDFWMEFQSRSGPAPTLQIYVLFGEEFEAHRSLVTRLVGDRLMSLEDAAWAGDEGAIGQLEILDWPKCVVALERRKRHIRAAFSVEARSRSKQTDTAHQILLESPGFRERKLMVVSQQIVADAWSDDERALLQWYVQDFWGKTVLGPEDPTIVLFLQVVCAEEMFADRSLEKAFADLEQLCAPGVSVTPLLLDQLTELTEQHLQNWFAKFIAGLAGPTLNIADAAQEVYQKAKTRRNRIPRTDHIEGLLATVHQEWIQK